MSKCLVTGAAGFMGSHLVEALISQGHEVVALDNLSGGFEDNLLSNVYSQQLIVGDITDQALIEGLFKRHRFHYVFHLAAYAAEGLSHWIRNFNYMNNLVGSVNLISASIKHRVRKFIFTSSMAVYGSNQTPFSEDMIPSPEDPYGVAKYAVEQDLAIAHKLFGLDYAIFRPHNVYGPKQNLWDRYRNVVGIFMNQLLNNEPMTVFGDGSQVRAFSYISDIIPAFIHAAFDDSLKADVFNVGGEEAITVKELSKLVAEALKIDPTYKYSEERAEVHVAFSDHSKLQLRYDWSSSVTIKEGVALMADWAKQVYHKRTINEFWALDHTIKLPNQWVT